MKKLQFHYQCTLPATPRELCAFHTNASNLPLITPPWIDVSILSMDVPMRQDSHIELQIKRFGISSLWKMKIAHLKCPETIVDKMVEGPFRNFNHERLFKVIDRTTTRMEETITLELPLGILGRWLYPWVKKEMDTMFAYRHDATKRYFEGQKSLSPSHGA